MKRWCFLLILLCNLTFSQHTIKELYNIDLGGNFPNEMESAKQFIDEFSFDCPVYNVTPSASSDYSFLNFKIKNSNGLRFDLPRLKGVYLEFLNPHNLEPIKEKQIQTSFTNPGLKTKGTVDFEHDSYVVKDYYDIGLNLVKLNSASEIVWRHLVYDASSSLEEKFKNIVDKINAKYKTSIGYVEEPLLSSVGPFADELSEVFDSDLPDVLYEVNVKGATETVTLTNTNTFFSKYFTDQQFKELVMSKLKIKTGGDGFLTIPEKYLISEDNNQKFNVGDIDVHFDFFNKQMIIIFNSGVRMRNHFIVNHATTLPRTGGIYNEKSKKIKDKKIVVKSILFVFDNERVSMMVEENYSKNNIYPSERFYKIDLN